MKHSRHKLTALFAFLLLIGLVGVSVILTWRQVRQEQLNHALIAAVNRNDTTAVRKLLWQGADPNAPVLPDDKRPFWDRLWETLLHKDVPRPMTPSSPLFQAAVWMAWDKPPFVIMTMGRRQPLPVIDNVETVRVLVDAGAHVNFRGGRKKATPLIVAAYFGKFETMKVLLAHNAEVNAVDTDSDVALISSAAGANASVVETLLQQGASVNQQGKGGQTAIYAVLNPFQRHDIKSVRDTMACLLRHGAFVDGKDEDGNTLLTLAGRFHDPQLIQMLKQAGAKE